MSVYNEANRHALREHRAHERATLERLEVEAMNLERYPEGEEPRGTTVVDGYEVPLPKRRIRGTLRVRW